MSSAPDFRGLAVETLRRAIGVYLAEAYPNGTPPESVRRRLEWPESAELSDLIAAGLPFERVTPTEGQGGPIYALRLGNARYPHMKLQVQAWPSSAGYMLSVNTHDQIKNLDPASPDASAFRALQSENQQIKEAIEAAWDREGFPTFLRYLRDYLDTRGEPPTTP